MVTPAHIQPEWYFLFVYTILRSIPRKIGGVIALLSSVLVLYFLPFVYVHRMRRNQSYPVMRRIFWLFVVNLLMLT